MSRRPPSDHFDGKRFFNPGPPQQGGFFSFLRWRLTGVKSGWPQWVENRHEAQPAASVEGGNGGTVVTFINHATVLVQTGGVNLLTDPVYSERASPVTFAGPKRVRRPGVAFENLPRIDAVLLSHNHYDHMDLPTLRRLAERDGPRWLAPLGNARHLRNVAGAAAVRELDWWERAEVKGVPVALAPARHFSARTPWDRNRSLWAGYWIGGEGVNGRGENEGGENARAAGARGPSVLFAADTAYGPHFREVGERLGRPDLALLPIGAYEPRWFMSPVHMDPAQALRGAPGPGGEAVGRDSLRHLSDGRRGLRRPRARAARGDEEGGGRLTRILWCRNLGRAFAWTVRRRTWARRQEAVACKPVAGGADRAGGPDALGTVGRLRHSGRPHFS